VAKGLNEKDIHKEIFSVYGGKCLSRKAVHNLVEKRGRRFVDDEELETEVAETTVKILLCCGALVKRWDKCINAGRGFVQK
jgi:hypothetical protein